MMIIYKGTPNNQLADFLQKPYGVRKKWNDVFKILKDKNSSKNTLSRKVVIQIWRRNKDFPNQKLREFTNTEPAERCSSTVDKSAKIHKTLSKIKIDRKFQLFVRIGS